MQHLQLVVVFERVHDESERSIGYSKEKRSLIGDACVVWLQGRVLKWRLEVEFIDEQLMGVVEYAAQ